MTSSIPVAVSEESQQVGAITLHSSKHSTDGECLNILSSWVQGKRSFLSIGRLSGSGATGTSARDDAAELIRQWALQSADVPPDAALKQITQSVKHTHQGAVDVHLLLGRLDGETQEFAFAIEGQCGAILLHERKLAQLGLKATQQLDLPELQQVTLRGDDRLIISNSALLSDQREDGGLDEADLLAMMLDLDASSLASSANGLLDALDGSHPSRCHQTLIMLEVSAARNTPLQLERASLPIDEHINENATRWLETHWEVLGLKQGGLAVAQRELRAALDERNLVALSQRGLQRGALLVLGLARFAKRVELECEIPEPPVHAMGDAEERPKASTNHTYRRANGHTIVRISYTF